MDPIGVGLVGVGVHGARYRDHLLRGDVTGLTLAGLCRRDVEEGSRQAQEAGVAFYATPRDLAEATSVGALAVVTPPAHHAEAADAALSVGKPALIEKPLAADLAEARALAERAGEAQIMVAHTLRFDPFWAGVSAAARDLGDVTRIEVVYGRPGLRERLSDATLHPALLDVGVHFFDWISSLTSCAFATAVAEEDSAGVRALLTGDAVTFGLGLFLDPEIPLAGVRVHTAGGVLEGDALDHTLSLAGESLALPEKRPAIVPTLEAFAALLGGGPNPVPLAQGVLALARGEACRQSLLAQAPMPLQEEGQL